jgi:alkylation response protein AidB-like acyl-CoA dehydrogenase
VNLADAIEAFAGRAAETEALGRLPDDNVRLLNQLGIPRILVPRRWGGDERLFAEMVEQVAELAHGCVSTAWCAGAVCRTMVHAAGRQKRQFDIAEHARTRLQLAHVVRLAVSAIDRLFSNSGGGALQETQPIPRLWRDVHAVQSHVAFNWGNHARNYGSIVAGQGATQEQL